MKSSRPNVLQLLGERETGCRRNLCVQRTGDTAVHGDLSSWKEDCFLRDCDASYAAFSPAPRSTIALCYNCNGTWLASTHGDHTVKITCCESKSIVRVLSGHRRTPWVVRFHPRLPHILASGSLDHEVRVWNAETGHCMMKHTFGKPIASLSFHLEASLLAIACGHKLYIWNYDVQGSRPEIVLKTRRSMRAVHFHPHGLPVILTAEVQDPSDTAGLPITLTENGPFFFDTKSNNVGTESMEVDEGCEGERCGIEDENQEQAFRRRPSWMDGDIMSEGLVTSQIARGISNSSLPPSMVPLGWEVPFPEAVGPVLNSVPTSPGLSEDAQLAAATYASVWNILGEDPTPRVRLKIWSFNPGKYASYLDSGDRLQLEISDAVLCSEMGVHFSPCGRYLAATVSCRAPMQHQTGLCAPGNTLESRTVEWSPQHAPETQDAAQASQTTLSLPERVVFEVRIISMDGPDFGATLKAKRIRAAHCLTSVQFSPTGDHVLLAYGKKHSSLLRSLVAHQNALIPLHTILEIVNTSNMKVFRALPSGDDEINAACFHPLPGGGVAYGTKEGKLRFIEPHRVA